jgi:hypothetical protein
LWRLLANARLADFRILAVRSNAVPSKMFSEDISGNAELIANEKRIISYNEAHEDWVLTKLKKARFIGKDLTGSILSGPCTACSFAGAAKQHLQNNRAMVALTLF